MFVYVTPTSFNISAPQSMNCRVLQPVLFQTHEWMHCHLAATTCYNNSYFVLFIIIQKQNARNIVNIVISPNE